MVKLQSAINNVLVVILDFTQKKPHWSILDVYSHAAFYHRSKTVSK